MRSYNTSLAKMLSIHVEKDLITLQVHISGNHLTGGFDPAQVSLRQQLVTLHAAQNKHLTTAACLQLLTTRKLGFTPARTFISPTSPTPKAILSK